MPPRYAYWTILVDNGPTAFRAALREDLLPTLRQLQRKNRDVVMKWFERGRLWESPEAARESRRAPGPIEKRGRDWRPGGAHQDPRAKFDRRPRGPKPAWRARPDAERQGEDQRGDRRPKGPSRAGQRQNSSFNRPDGRRDFRPDTRGRAPRGPRTPGKGGPRGGGR